MHIFYNVMSDDFFLNIFIIRTFICIYTYMILCLDTEGTTDEVLMLKGSLSPYLDTHNEEESSYVTLSNGPYGKYQPLYIYT